MKAFEIRAKAREALKGQWGKVILLLVIYFIITFVLSFVLAFIPFIGAIVNYIITIPLVVGITASIMKIARREEFSYFEFVNIAIELFGKSWGVVGHILLKMLLPVILLIVSIVLMGAGMGMAVLGETSTLAIIAILLYIVALVYVAVKGMLFYLANNILIDNPEMSTKDIVEKSASLMNGNRWKLICLELSFIGWAFLAGLTFGIGCIWLIPYMAISQVFFYMALVQKNETVVEE